MTRLLAEMYALSTTFHPLQQIVVLLPRQLNVSFQLTNTAAHLHYAFILNFVLCFLHKNETTVT